jgi:hypothetical protein
MEIESVIAGITISLLNTVAAVLIIKKAFKTNPEKFNKIVFSSLVIRYFVVAGLILLGLLVFELDKFWFSLSFMISTFILLMFEIIYINSKANLLNLHNKTVAQNGNKSEGQ